MQSCLLLQLKGRQDDRAVGTLWRNFREPFKQNNGDKAVVCTFIAATTSRLANF